MYDAPIYYIYIYNYTVHFALLYTNLYKLIKLFHLKKYAYKIFNFIILLLISFSISTLYVVHISRGWFT